MVRGLPVHKARSGQIGTAGFIGICEVRRGARNPEFCLKEGPAFHSHERPVLPSPRCWQWLTCSVTRRFTHRIITIVIQLLDFVAVEPLISGLHPGAEGPEGAQFFDSAIEGQPLWRNAGIRCDALCASTETVQPVSYSRMQCPRGSQWVSHEINMEPGPIWHSPEKENR